MKGNDMKRRVHLSVAIIWFLVAIICFISNKFVVGMPWLLIGLFNLVMYYKTCQMDKTKREVMETLEKNEVKDMKESNLSIERLNEEHFIEDETIGYGYCVDKSFKAAKSHAGEVELLCTFAPNDEYGHEGDVPYIAVITDDDVYCAVEEYKINKTFDGALYIEPVDGVFMFRAKKEYYDDMMYFYGFELPENEFWDMAGLCLVYPKEYVGTKEEVILTEILDAAAQSFRKRNK